MAILSRLTPRRRTFFPGRERPSRSVGRLRLEELETRLALSNYYVAPTGNDLAVGSAGAPWKTLQHAANEVGPGDVVAVRPGNYTGFIMGWNGPQSGTAAARITFQAEPGAIINARNNKTADAINLESTSYVTISGFTIAPAADQAVWRSGLRGAGGGTGLVFSNNTIQIRPSDACGIVTSFTTDLLVQGNTVSGGWDTGVYVANSAVRPVVRGNRISNSLSNGVLLNADASQGGNGIIPGAVVENNIISDVGMGGALAKFGKGSAMNFGGVRDSVIRNNLIYDAHAKGITLAQLQASQGSTNNLVVNNTVVIASDGQAALRIADSSTGNAIFNNVLSSTSYAGTLTSSAASLAGLLMDYNAVSGGFSTNDGDSSLTLAQWQSQSGQDRHSSPVDLARSFVNVAGKNFHLPSTSPLIDVGTSQRAPSTDLEGGSRPSGNGFDIGAYEYTSAGDTIPPQVTSTSPSANATGVSTAAGVTAIFSEAVQSGTINLVLKDAAKNVVPATLSYAAGTNAATLKPSAPLASSSTYSVSLDGAKDVAGNVMAGTVTWSFSTAAAPAPPTTTSYALWSPSTRPFELSDQDTNAVELGVKFSSNLAGSVTGIRFYKGPGNAGTHVGHLWSGSGQLLASANFTSETTSGWQQVNFAAPVAIKANTTYVASYLAPVGRYSVNEGYFASSYANGPLRVPANGGVYKYGTGGGFPTQTWNATNYWVDLVLATSTAPKATTPDSPAGTTSSVIPPGPGVARAALASSSSSSPTIPTGETYPTSAGVDQVFAIDDGSYFPNIPGVRRKPKQA